MRRFLGRAFGAVLAGLLASAGPAAAGCGGSDLLAPAAQSGPDLRAEVFRRAKTVPNGQGRFWRVSRAGVSDSWLFGTFHDTDIARAPLPPAVDAALGHARVLLVEVTPDEQARMQRRMVSEPGFVIDPAGRDLLAGLAPEPRRRAETRLAARGIPPAMAAKMRRWLLFSAIAVPVCMMQDAARGAPTLDNRLAEIAAARGVAIGGLESFEAALAALDSIPPETMDAMLVSMLTEDSDEEDVRATVAQLYRDGETAAIWTFSAIMAERSDGSDEGRALLEVMDRAVIVARNRAWMAVLGPELALGNAFAAFGALHLPGEVGVIELLRADGFTVTRADG